LYISIFLKFLKTDYIKDYQLSDWCWGNVLDLYKSVCWVPISDGTSNFMVQVFLGIFQSLQIIPGIVHALS
jgi:hypothetical protein